MLDDWCSYEDASKWLVAQGGNGEVCFERFSLPAEGVPFDRYIKAAQELLFRFAHRFVVCLVREHDHSSAGSECGEPLVDSSPDCLEDSSALGEPSDSCALASGDNEPVDLLRIRRCLNPGDYAFES